MKMSLLKNPMHGDQWCWIVKENPPGLGLKLEQYLHLAIIESQLWQLSLYQGHTDVVKERKLNALTRKSQSTLKVG